MGEAMIPCFVYDISYRIDARTRGHRPYVFAVSREAAIREVQADFGGKATEIVVHSETRTHAHESIVRR